MLQEKAQFEMEHLVQLKHTVEQGSVRLIPRSEDVLRDE
jgi:hypothetical protein